MKKIKNEDFANALTAVETMLTNGILDKEYDGYVSSLGASIINSGLLPTLSFYTDVHKSASEVRRFKLLKAIFAVVNPTAAEAAGNDNKGLLNYVLEKVYGEGFQHAPAGTLGEGDKKELAKQKSRLLEAAVAVKLAMRNFKHSDSRN